MRFEPIEFEGVDYTELADYWGLIKDKDEHYLFIELEAMEAVIEHINKALDFYADDMVVAKTAHEVRCFLDALILTSGRDEIKVWEALLLITNNYTFLRFAVRLVPLMWN